ncbi:hypothetical protein IPJ72_03735 [Candidatus Peregrinibacteria bacterium]|nr:MAG: hypothetical protein IPJ72_03735 [Candidatus Peregrinibacteria bacterium]
MPNKPPHSSSVDARQCADAAADLADYYQRLLTAEFKIISNGAACIRPLGPYESFEKKVAFPDTPYPLRPALIQQRQKVFSGIYHGLFKEFSPTDFAAFSDLDSLDPYLRACLLQNVFESDQNTFSDAFDVHFGAEGEIHPLLPNWCRAATLLRAAQDHRSRLQELLNPNTKLYYRPDTLYATKKARPPSKAELFAADRIRQAEEILSVTAQFTEVTFPYLIPNALSSSQSAPINLFTPGYSFIAYNAPNGAQWSSDATAESVLEYFEKMPIYSMTLFTRPQR